MRRPIICHIYEIIQASILVYEVVFNINDINLFLLLFIVIAIKYSELTLNSYISKNDILPIFLKVNKNA